MGNKEILQVVELFSNEKGIPKGIIFEAIEHALAVSYTHLTLPTNREV